MRVSRAMMPAAVLVPSHCFEGSYVWQQYMSVQLEINKTWSLL
jgi:hypothetical protein